MSGEILIYREQPINISLIRDRLQRFRTSEGALYYSPEELEKQVQHQVLQKKCFIGRMQRRDKNDGYRLAFYAKEHKLFPEAYSVKVSDDEAKTIVKKLLRHFGSSNKAKWLGDVRFYGNRQSGGFGWRIRLSHNPSIGLICHEVSHVFNRRHDKKLMKWMNKMINYCEKKNLWRNN